MSLAEGIAELKSKDNFTFYFGKEDKANLQTKKYNDFGEGLNWMISEARKGASISRYKGLGEMNAEQLWETTMDPEVRQMTQVQISSEREAHTFELFDILMGDDVEPRRNFIEENALNVVNLDID